MTVDNAQGSGERAGEVRNDGPTFLDCVMLCARTPEFVENWQRLRGMSLGKTPIDRMIDEATGYDREICEQFLNDVWECVWARFPGADAEV